MVRAGRILSGVAVFLLLLDAAGKLFEHAKVIEGTVRLGYPASLVVAIGVIELVCVLIYAVPRTAIAGAVLLTGYLGGAVATHLRIGDPLWTHVLAPVYMATFVWAGLALRRDWKIRRLGDG
jgi:DoxX-like protein